MAYSHSAGRSHERDLLHHLRKLGFYAVDLATEKGIGQLTEEDGLLWPPDIKPDPLWYRGEEYLTDCFEYQAKWSQEARGFKKVYNAHERKEVNLGGVANAHHPWRYGDEGVLRWGEANVYTGGLNALHQFLDGYGIAKTPIDYKLTSFLEGCLRADIVLLRAPNKPFIAVWETDLLTTHYNLD